MSSTGSIAIGEGSAPSRASLPSVFGIALGLGIVVVCLSTLLGYGAKTVDAAPALAERYELSSVPFGLELHEKLFLLPSGERVFLFSDGSEPEVVPTDLETEAPSEESEGEGSGSDEESEKEQVDWSLAKPTLENGPLSKVYLVHYPTGKANSIIDGQFRRVDWKDLRFLDNDGDRTAIDGGKIEWDGYSADFVLEREFIPELRFADRIRVNLTLGGECWIAYGLWSEQEAGSQEVMQTFLGALRLVEEADLAF